MSCSTGSAAQAGTQPVGGSRALRNLVLIAARLRSSRTERGASAVEYGLLIAGIAALIVVAVFALGPVVEEAFADTCESMTGASGTMITADCD